MLPVEPAILLAPAAMTIYRRAVTVAEAVGPLMQAEATALPERPKMQARKAW
jgi:hypothetical protein